MLRGFIFDKVINIAYQYSKNTHINSINQYEKVLFPTSQALM